MAMTSYARLGIAAVNRWEQGSNIILYSSEQQLLLIHRKQRLPPIGWTATVIWHSIGHEANERLCININNTLKNALD